MAAAIVGGELLSASVQIAEHAFGANNSSERSNIEEIGREIVKKCDGLPLAAVELGGLFRTKLSRNDWNKVLRSNICDLPNLKVQPALLLSYHFLPAPLKHCFAYCSIFPKNSVLEKEIQVRLWIAEGLVHVSKSKKILEEVGDEFNFQGKIVDPCDASQANMKKKEQIEDLSLEWDSCTAQESQHLVLEHLQPSTNSKKLTIKFYGGTWFPNWLGNSSFALSPVGQLHNLKELIIFDIISVKTIGPEFYGIEFKQRKKKKDF
ncbi:Putative disease resistance RPP13-like protein [Arachis hypogaea]|nr:Putative disease resistance RPP13-like protein [Arachis hypogaea]